MRMPLVRKCQLKVVIFLSAALYGSCALAASSTPLDVQVFKTSPTEFFGGSVPDYIDMLIDSGQEITWDVVIPKTYTPERPAGLIVYISYTATGLPPKRWQREFDSKNLIWIAARGSGNTEINGKRKAYAILGKLVAERNFEIDPSRVYLSGLSGGGRLSSLIMPEVPHLFSGAIYFCGVNFISEAEEHYEALRDKRFVFITGSRDFNLAGTRYAHRQYRKVGVKQSLLIVVPGMGHELPPARTFGKAIKYLDKRPS